MTARDLDVVWVVGANPLAHTDLASTGAFVVVQEMFMTETAKRADVIFPAASAYEKDGTVTNVTGEVQQLKRAAEDHGREAGSGDLRLDRQGHGREGFLAAKPEMVFDEIRQGRARV